MAPLNILTFMSHTSLRIWVMNGHNILNLMVTVPLVLLVLAEVLRCVRIPPEVIMTSQATDYHGKHAN
jgi:uncharacterized membrane protein YqjE